MPESRRSITFLSILCIGAGLALLAAAGAAVVFSSREPPAAWSAAESSPEELPPALLPVTPEAPAAPPLPAAEANGLILLPEPPSTVEAEPTPLSTPLTPPPPPLISVAAAADDLVPLRLLIPALEIDAPVQVSKLEPHSDGRHAYYRWIVPDAYAAGWHELSALPGQPGNTVLNGHNNVHGAIFGDLVHLATGEQIILETAAGSRLYRVVHHELLPEKGATLHERLLNARWIAPTDDERLTLVTCWPNTTNSHRLIIVASPVEASTS